MAARRAPHASRRRSRRSRNNHWHTEHIDAQLAVSIRREEADRADPVERSFVHSTEDGEGGQLQLVRQLDQEEGGGVQLRARAEENVGFGLENSPNS
eukprot:11878514-Alexandrium_andersonii.AAC.1